MKPDKASTVQVRRDDTRPRQGEPDAPAAHRHRAAAGAPASPIRDPASAPAALAGATAAPGGAPGGAPQVAALQSLIKLEADLRDIAGIEALRIFAANEPRRLTGARQIFVVGRSRRRGWRVEAISSVASVDRQSLLVRAITQLVTGLAAEAGLDEARVLALPAYCEPDGVLAQSYPFRELMWVPLRSRAGIVFGGLLLARETPWSDDERSLGLRLGGAIAHSWLALDAGAVPRLRRSAWPWRTTASLALLALLALPVPMAALAPVEIVPRDPYVVAAPIDGAIESIAIDPGTRVAAGDVLVRFVDTATRNRYEVAVRDALVAEARLKQATQTAFQDVRGRRELGIAAAEVGVMEVPPGSNRGPRVDEYLESVGLDPSDDSYLWCAAFVYWTFQKAAAQVGSENPCIRTAGVLDHWNKAAKAGATRLTSKAVIDDFSLLKPGLIFVISTGEGKGHMGIVEDFRDDRLITIEGNTNLPGAREGVGVFRRTSRKLSDINKGFISYDS